MEIYLPFATELYTIVKSTWPLNGKTILAVHSKNCDAKQKNYIIVYQAYKPSIAKYAVEHQTFKNCPDFSTNRMSWIKTNFLWMMFRSGWATKKDQERILAISLTTEGFEEMLKMATAACSNKITNTKEETPKEAAVVQVRLQWDPDHDPFGGKLERRAIQLGIRGNVLDAFINTWVTRIDDITEFVEQQREFVQKNQLEFLKVPVETYYYIDDDALRKHIGLTP